MKYLDECDYHTHTYTHTFPLETMRVEDAEGKHILEEDESPLSPPVGPSQCVTLAGRFSKWPLTRKSLTFSASCLCELLL